MLLLLIEKKQQNTKLVNFSTVVAGRSNLRIITDSKHQQWTFKNVWVMERESEETMSKHSRNKAI